ncbi:hypothetical protein HJC23_008121 [Cyclotella cryptica]|uniref:Uncharacterized protein n=1 Tax=Cyclotella cryptica TaxID=29204 RepID=A0ABD3NXA9_9STRA
MDNNPTGSLPQDNNVMTRRMKSCPYLPLLVLLTTTCSTATTSSSCSFSDILSNNTACLPTLLAEGSFVALPPLELQLQFNDGNNTNADNDVDASLEGIRFALEYYLNYSLSRFDDVEAGFDNGGFAYAKVDNVAPASSSSSEPVRMLRRQTTTRSLLSSSSSWRLSVSAGAFYNLSPGGWIFSSIPTSMELLQRVQSVVEEPLDDSDDNVVVGGKFAEVLKMLLFDREGLQAFRNVMGVKVVLEEEETGRPSLRPTWISLESTLAPTIGVLTTDSSSTNEPASDSPTILSTAIMITNGPTVSGIEISPAPSKEPTVLVTPIPTQLGIQSIEPSSQWPTVVMIKTLPPTRTNNDASIGGSVVSSSPSPTVANRNGDGGSTPHSMTPSNPFETDQNRSDAPFGLAAGTNIESNDDDTLGVQTNGNSIDDNSISANSNNNSQTEGNINKELLSSTSSDKNKSKIIASSTLAISFLILVLVSGAFVIQRRGRNRKELKGDKSFPLHFLADNGLKGDEEAEEKSLSGEYLEGDHFHHELNGNSTSKQHVSSSSEADFTVAAAAATTAVLISKEEKNANNETCPTPVTPRKSKSEPNLPREMNQQNHSSNRPVRNRVRIIPSGAASSPNDSNRDNRHRSVQSTYHYSPNNAVNLSNEKSHTTPSDKNNDSLMSTPSINGYDPSYVIAHYDEERIAKKEMARELFLTKEQMKRVGRSHGTDTNLISL